MLEFPDDALDEFAREMNTILDFFAELREVDTAGVEPAFRVLRRLDVTRPDEPRDSLTRDEALSNAPDRAGDSFRVPDYLPDEQP
jgi:aspartyl-tRNA(Asn)/glutamyl-tRNA(Gln) amidotransferase subunit C